MRWLDRIFTRRHRQRCFDRVPQRVEGRMVYAFHQLSEQERQAQAELGLLVPPRLLFLDEELAVIIRPDLRRAIEAKAGTGPERMS